MVAGPWASAMVFSGTYNQLLTYVVFVGFLYALSCAAVMVLRHRTGDAQTVPDLGYLITPVVFILFSGYLILNTIVNAPRDAAIGGGLLALGLPVRVWCRRRTTVSRER